MTAKATSSKLRWTVPVVVALLLVGGTVTTRSVLAAAQSSGLPVRSPAELLVDLQQATVGALSGTVVQTADLGIPELPGLGGGGSSDLTSLISGTHTLRIWHDGTDKARIALLGTLGESDIIRNGSDLWIWSSKDNSASHRTLSTADAGVAGFPDPTDLPMTPQEAADAFLTTLDASTVVSSDGSPVVAGRSAYQLTLAPRDATGALISSVRIAIDAVEHIPLRVQVFAVGRPAPVFEVAFSSVDFAAPDAAQFTFNPPPGATVTELPAAGDTEIAPHDQGFDPAGPPAEVIGTGWTAVLVGSIGSEVPTSVPLQGITNALPAVSGSWGSGHLFAGTVFSAVIADDGRVAIGAVQPELLYTALAG